MLDYIQSYCNEGDIRLLILFSYAYFSQLYVNGGQLRW